MKVPTPQEVRQNGNVLSEAEEVALKSISSLLMDTKEFPVKWLKKQGVRLERIEQELKMLAGKRKSLAIESE